MYQYTDTEVVLSLRRANSVTLLPDNEVMIRRPIPLMRVPLQEIKNGRKFDVLDRKLEGNNSI